MRWAERGKKRKLIQWEEIKEKKVNRMIDQCKQYIDELELLQYVTLKNYRHNLHSLSSCCSLLTGVGVST